MYLQLAVCVWWAFGKDLCGARSELEVFAAAATQLNITSPVYDAILKLYPVSDTVSKATACIQALKRNWVCVLSGTQDVNSDGAFVASTEPAWLFDGAACLE